MVWLFVGGTAAVYGFMMKHVLKNIQGSGAKAA